jgi:hypothetical protein
MDLLHSPLSAPAQRVEAETDYGTERFSRSLDQRSPHVRSSTALIVPMEADEQIHPADAFVIKWSLRCVVALLVIYAVEWWFA